MKTIKQLLYQAAALKPGSFVKQPLTAQGSWPESVHLLDKQSLLAIAAAVGAQRPLLVRGEPGTGKSQLARAAAALLKRHFISTVVQPFTEYQELLWTFDYTQRLADAQLLSLGIEQFKLGRGVNAKATSTDGNESASLLAPEQYTGPGPLWFAFDWSDAQEQPCRNGYQPESTKDGQAPEALVLLIDEIDKADVSLSNGLLEVLGNGGFRVPHRQSAIGGATEQIPPLVILTSNSVRELPSALLRRCVLLDLKFPEGDALEAHLIKIGAAHFTDLSETVLQAAAKQICRDREQQAGHSLKTGQAEYIDLLQTLKNSGLTQDEQIEYLEDLAGFFFKRQPG